jgi:3-hydroxyacyl-[acyl-carrier-protein] dehydratase
MNEIEIKERFFNFDPATITAICDYQKQPNPDLVPVIVNGIIAKYLPPELRERAPEAMQSFNVFGIESVTLMEIILDIQDALNLVITDAELRSLHSFEEASKLLTDKMNALRAETPTPN